MHTHFAAVSSRVHSNERVTHANANLVAPAFFLILQLYSFLSLLPDGEFFSFLFMLV